MGGDEAAEAPTPPSARTSVRTSGGASARVRSTLLWSGLAVLLVLAAVAAFGAVQRTFYSPAGFAAAYVDALAHRDVLAALAMPGADPAAADLTAQGLPAHPSRELLRGDVLPRLTRIRVAGDDVLPSGEHRVVVRADADGRPVSSTFMLRQTGSVLGVLPTWAFSHAPLAVAHVDVQHAGTFDLAGHTLDPRATGPQRADGFGAAADYLLFAPARYTLSHHSRYLSAAPVEVATRAGAVSEVVVDAQPNAAFTSLITDRVHSFLDGCAGQPVLQPAGCPFGVDIVDRVQGSPAWRIARYPAVQLLPGAAGWVMPRAAGVAHLSATVQSLFDGSVESRESDEPFVMSLSTVRIRPDGGVDIVVAQ